MPYLKPGRKAELMTEPQRAYTAGDANYLYTRVYLEIIIKNPRYETIAHIRKASLNPDYDINVRAVEDILTINAMPHLDRQVARDLAFQEFYLRIGSLYESYARMQNGDLIEYENANRAILEKFQAAEVQ